MNSTEPQNQSIKQLLLVMEKQDASDLYITVGMPPSYRINGQVRTLKQSPLTASQCERLASATMNERQKAAFAAEYEMNLALSFDDVGRFRVNIFRQRGHVGMVIRKVKLEIPTLEGLGLPDIFQDISMESRGLVLMVGATGSGKSTSLAAMIDWRNRHQAGHIISIEDPIEFIHEHKKCVITQREVGTDTLEYQAALKNTLRQAPDVILIGEIRDRETMEHALEFAETGHLCLATLHANNANQALERIINFFPEEMHPQVCLNLAMNLKALLSQRLVKTPDEARVPAIEILINTPRISDLIGKWAIAEIKESMASGKNYGMQTFDQSLQALWMQGIITEDEALRHADSVNNLRLQIKMVNLKDSGGDLHDMDQLSGTIDTPELKI
ncbi:PilT/PilU family type 4a pilus ATPase [Mariprofundus sp. EBB-1]|uniref:PilT/PilU family type 4a pilus ATPase n=1 Tax=Mariprofundus sp. EBB-1 TaxID=2650971 RepID=UPI000EF22387|nr:PilT/PilU family type 4a pilus ATPase [Mariprofundus sp. EBB-1]RLL56013.1 PilT/PilU family type 4a pilus ATPase [Mariprofundus sp. EBB-1]